MSKFISVAIDGPAGAGKSTVAKQVAKELGFLYVDTGAIYRTVGYHMQLMGIGPKDTDGICRCIDDVNIRMEYQGDGAQHMILNGSDVTELIRTPEISAMASGVAAQGCVRDYLLEMQRSLARTNNVVMDGRDIGTVVLPDAFLKVYMTASADVRAKRRFDELVAKGENPDFETLKAEIIERDYRDSHREIAPLRQAEDAFLLDTSDMSIDMVAGYLLGLYDERKNFFFRGE